MQRFDGVGRRMVGQSALRTVLYAVMLAANVAGALAEADPLPSWRDNPNKARILKFVADVTVPGSPQYVSPRDRIAVFDDDGTLIPEKPRVQGMLSLERLRARAPEHPEWRIEMPYRGALELGRKFMAEAKDEDVVQLVAAAFAGAAQDDFRRQVETFYATATHPRFDVPYGRLAYQPMKEVLALLKANGFRVFIVTTGNADVVQAVSESVYGVPGDDVIGRRVGKTLREENGVMVVRRLQTVTGGTDGDNKALSIDDQVGGRPLLAAGNVRSGGDLGLLRYSQGDGSRPSLQILVMHDDFEREYAYAEPDRASLDAADKQGWVVVSMRFDWKRLFAFQELATPGTTEPATPIPAARAEP